MMQCRQRLPIQGINLETCFRCLIHPLRLRLRHVLFIRNEDWILSLCLALVRAPDLGDVSIDQNAIIVLTTDLTALSCWIDLGQAFPAKVAPDGSFPARV